MSHGEAYLPETPTSGRADVTVLLGPDRRDFADHFVRIDGTSRVLGVFEPETHRPVLTTALENCVVHWTE